jgi:hypothetical protein
MARYRITDSYGDYTYMLYDQVQASAPIFAVYDDGGILRDDWEDSSAWAEEEDDESGDQTLRYEHTPYQTATIAHGSAERAAELVLGWAYRDDGDRLPTVTVVE